MASIRPRTTKAGVTSYAVLYRHGGRQSSLTFETMAAAEKFKALVELLGPDKALSVLAGDGPDDRLTVAQLAEKFLEWKGRPGGVTERTLADYTRDVNNWIVPWFGHRAAESIDEADVQKWVDHMNTRMAPKSVADRHVLLHSMFAFGRAKSRGLVSHNPCLETELPARIKKPPKGTTVPEFVALLNAAAKLNPDAADLILYLGETGWRFSEAIALDVRDIEDNGDDVWVNVTRVFRVDGRGHQYLAEGAAKSEAAFRRIRLLPESAAMVRRRVVGKRPGDLVFMSAKGRPWNQKAFLRYTWPPIVKAAKLGPTRRPTPHWLRHMHVAVMLAAGAGMHEVQRRIGHEHYSTTVDVYGGMIGDVKDDALASAGELMAGRRTAPTIAPGQVVAGELVRSDHDA